MPIDTKKYLNGGGNVNNGGSGRGSGGSYGKINTSKYLSYNPAIDNPGFADEQATAELGRPQPPLIPPPTADSYRQLKGDSTLDDAMRAVHGDTGMPQQKLWGLGALDAKLNPIVEGWLNSNPVTAFLHRTSQQGANLIANGGQQLPGQNLASTGNKTADSIADMFSYGALPLAPGAGLQSAGTNAATQGLSKLLPSLGSKANKFTSNVLGAGTLGLGFGAQKAGVKSIDDPNYTFGQGVKDTLGEGLLFAGGDAALRGVGIGLKAGADKLGITDMFRGVAQRLSKRPSVSPGTPAETPLIPSLTQSTPVRNQAPSTLRPVNHQQNAWNEFEQGVETVRNFLGHDDILAAYPQGTKIEDALAHIKENTGVDLQTLLANVEKASVKPLSNQLNSAADVSRLGRVAGALEPKPFNVAKTPGPVAPPLPVQPIRTPQLPQTPVQPAASNKVVQLPSAKAPELPTGGLEQRGFINTLQDSSKSTQPFLERLSGAYEKIPQEVTVGKANERVSANVDDAYNYVMSATKYTPEHVATAHRLIDEFQARGDFSRAVDVAERVAEQGTKAGQTVNAFNIYNKLSPEGILVHAGRIVNKVNEKGSVLSKEATITVDTAAKLTDLASTVQTMTGTKKVANDVLTIMEKAKNGTKLTDGEIQTVQQFVNDAKTVIGDLAPRKAAKQAKMPNSMLNTKTRDNVVSYLDAQEKAARERLKERGYRVMSGIPVDDFYDWSIIGASKMAKGAVKFADFSEQMIREFGDQVQPFIKQLYDKSTQVVQGSAKQLTEVERIVNRVTNSKALSEQEAQALKDMAGQVAKLSGDAKIEASQELQATLQLLERSSLGQKVSSVQTMGQLLNPKTLVRNAIGNELFYRLERLNKFVTTPFDWARVNLSNAVLGTNLQRSVTFATNNQGQYWSNWMKGLQAGWKGVNPEGLTTQFDLKAPAFNGKWNPLTYLEKTLGASLKSFDYAAYKRAVNHTIGEMATLRAINEGLVGKARTEAIQRYIREADENVLQIADNYGKYVTFQDNNLISVGLQKFKNGLNLGKDFGVGDLVIKYPRTPGAILMRALEYSPAGFLRSAYVAAKPLLQKGSAPNTGEAMMALSRGITGTFGLSAVGYFLIDNGILTGPADKDKDVRELQTMTGQGAYKVNIDALTRWAKSGFNKEAAKPQQGDNLVSYNWMQPVAINIALGATAKKMLNEPNKGLADVLGDGFSIVDGAATALVENSVLQGVQRALQSYPGQTVGDKMFDIASQLPASFAPTLGNQIRQLTDNTTRNTYDPNKLQEVKNTVKNKLPGIANQLPPSFDTLGKQKEVYQDGSNNLFNVFLNPAFTSKFKTTPEAQKVLDVMGQTGDTSIVPRVADKKVTINGNSLKLTPQEYSDYQQRLGQETAKLLRSFTPKSNNESNIANINDRLTEAKVRALQEIQKKHQELKRKAK